MPNSACSEAYPLAELGEKMREGKQVYVPYKLQKEAFEGSQHDYLTIKYHFNR
jgi:hypothetical protein